MDVQVVQQIADSAIRGLSYCEWLGLAEAVLNDDVLVLAMVAGGLAVGMIAWGLLSPRKPPSPYANHTPPPIRASHILIVQEPSFNILQLIATSDDEARAWSAELLGHQGCGVLYCCHGPLADPLICIGTVLHAMSYGTKIHRPDDP